MTTDTPTDGAPLLTPRQVAELLHVTPRTLEDWRCRRGVELPFVKLGGVVRYRRADVERLIEAGTQRVRGVH